MVCSFVDEEAITTPTDKRVDDISAISVLEEIKKIGLYLIMFYTYVGTK